MEILDLIDSLEELVVQARRLPGGNLVVDRKRILDVVDQMRLAVPADLKQAALIIETRDRVLSDAHESVQKLLERADEERGRLLEQTTIMQEAHERSHAMLIDAESRARQTIAEADATAASHLSEAAEAASRQLDDADDYALEVLRRMENQLQAFLESIKLSITSLQEQR